MSTYTKPFRVERLEAAGPRPLNGGATFIEVSASYGGSRIEVEFLAEHVRHLTIGDQINVTIDLDPEESA